MNFTRRECPGIICYIIHCITKSILPLPQHFLVEFRQNTNWGNVPPPPLTLAPLLCPHISMGPSCQPHFRLRGKISLRAKHINKSKWWRKKSRGLLGFKNKYAISPKIGKFRLVMNWKSTSIRYVLLLNFHSMFTFINTTISKYVISSSVSQVLLS